MNVIYVGRSQIWFSIRVQFFRPLKAKTTYGCLDITKYLLALAGIAKAYILL